MAGCQLIPAGLLCDWGDLPLLHVALTIVLGLMSHSVHSLLMVIMEAQEARFNEQAHFKPLLPSSCLLIAHWPKQVPLLSPESGIRTGQTIEAMEEGRCQEDVDTGKSWDQVIHSTIQAYSVPGAALCSSDTGKQQTSAHR